MVHTMQVVRRVFRTTAEMLLYDLFDDEPANRLLNGDIKFIERDIFDYIGFNNITLKSVPGSQYYMVSLVINPAVLSSGQRTIRLFDCVPVSLQRLQRAFIDTVADMTEAHLPSLDRWSVHRIDYAVDIITEHAYLYSKLAKRVQYPWRYYEKYKGVGSAYFGCTSVTLNFYDKQDQVRKKYSELSYFAHLDAEAQDVFRAEVQCELNKVKSIKHRFGLADTRALTMLRSDIATQVVLGYLRSTLGEEEFVSMAVAERRVRASGCQVAKQQRVLDFLQLITQCRRLDSAKEQYVLGTPIKNDKSGKVVQGSSSKFDAYIKDCADLGFNPVILPRDWRLPNLPNLIDLL